MPSAGDTIRILVATDSHVGYEERDPIRKDDSWRSFDEVMQLARTQDVDMVLLAGDLFHDNKPSRKSMYQVMRSLRQNCLGEKPCELQLMCDANDIFDGAFTHVNYEDPDINVAIPVFSIHGNHDDPSGDGHYCSLDLLQVSGLLNYFGRIAQNDKIEVKPVLLQKGSTKLALYGLSNVRDERLYRTFREKHVTFFKPTVQQQGWFNLMAVHQNHHAHSDTNYLPENFLPDWLDLVVWGHEHECLIEPRENQEMGFHVMQPGSSIATSLVPGEAVAKHVAIVSITGKEFSVEKHRIKSVRPFITKELVLGSDDRFRGLAKLKDNRTKLGRKLEDAVLELIQEATDEWLAIQDEDVAPEHIPLPLIRLKIEYSAPDGGKFDVENPQRFSNRFVGKVANCSDVVQFYRKKTGTKQNKAQKDMPDEAVLAAMDTMDNVKVEKLVHDFLNAQSLKILPQEPFGDAVTQFVDKQDKLAMETFVQENLAVQVKQLLLANEDSDEDELESNMDRIRTQQEELFKAGALKRKSKKKKVRPRPQNWDSDEYGAWEDQPGAVELSAVEDEEEDAPPAGRRKKAASLLSDDDISMVSGTTKKTAAKKAPAKKASIKPRASAKAKPPAKAPASRGSKKAVMELSDDEDNDSDVIMIDEAPAPVKSQPKRAAAAKGRQTQLNFSQPTQPKSSAARELSDDEISDDDDAFEPMSKRR
ncbi:putative double-strand break repair protein mus-23 [Stipitochalara longipes BDJ]|nr:putative double-strand break repair protein mus-23 [Stipitochalara longipes BDJ]